MNMGTAETKRPTVQLQGVGLHFAKQAGDLEPGDTLVWNYGHSSTVVSVAEASPSFVALTEVSHLNGQTYSRRLGKTRLVGYGGASFEGHYNGLAGTFAYELVGTGRHYVTFTPSGGKKAVLTSGEATWPGVREKYEAYREQHKVGRFTEELAAAKTAGA